MSAACRSDACLLYTSDAADDLHGVDLGGRRIIKKGGGGGRDAGVLQYGDKRFTAGI